MIRMTKRQRHILEETKPFGLREDLTIPVQAPGEYRGSCSFAGRETGRPTADLFGAAQVIGMFAFEAARRLQRARWAPGTKTPDIPAPSQRELDCIALVGCGKGNAEIGGILNTSPNTVRQYIEDPRDKRRITVRLAPPLKNALNHIMDGACAAAAAFVHRCASDPDAI